MFRIDSPSAVPSIPITPPPFAPGFFTDGNPASGAEATIVDAWWLNMVQEEILTVITSIGMAPDKADSSQLYQAIQRIAEAANPDLAGFLPLSGGVLYRPGGGDLLTIKSISRLRRHCTRGSSAPLSGCVPGHWAQMRPGPFRSPI